LAAQVGLIEWVDHTAPFKAILQGGLNRDPAFLRRNQALLRGGKAMKGAGRAVDIQIGDTFSPLKE